MSTAIHRNIAKIGEFRIVAHIHGYTLLFFVQIHVFIMLATSYICYIIATWF